MKIISSASKALVVTALLGVVIAGCDRKPTDQASADRTSGNTAASVAPSSTLATEESAKAGGNRDALNSNAASSGGSPSSAGTSGAADSSGSSSSTTTASSAGSMIDDGIITTKVKAALISNSDVKGSDISVETKHGEVLLSGYVSDQRQADKAVKTAMSVKGVKNVNNKMEVKQ